VPPLQIIVTTSEFFQYQPNIDMLTWDCVENITREDTIDITVLFKAVASHSAQRASFFVTGRRSTTSFLRTSVSAVLLQAAGTRLYRISSAKTISQITSSVCMLAVQPMRKLEPMYKPEIDPDQPSTN
jgi:hypothetical protein